MTGSDPRELQAILAGARPPGGLEREDRVQLIGEVATALLAGRMPSDAARLFIAGALSAWLENGGSLERDYLRTVKPKSHRTPAAIWRDLRAHPDERQDGATGSKLRPSSTTESHAE